MANLTYESWKQLKRRFALYYYEVSDGEDTTQFPPATTPTPFSNSRRFMVPTLPGECTGTRRYEAISRQPSAVS
jgi:hypothetical protein